MVRRWSRVPVSPSGYGGSIPSTSLRDRSRARCVWSVACLHTLLRSYAHAGTSQQGDRAGLDVPKSQRASRSMCGFDSRRLHPAFGAVRGCACGDDGSDEGSTPSVSLLLGHRAAFSGGALAAQAVQVEAGEARARPNAAIFSTCQRMRGATSRTPHGPGACAVPLKARVVVKVCVCGAVQA